MEGDAAAVAVAVAIGEVGGFAGVWGIASSRRCARDGEIRGAEGGSDGDWGEAWKFSRGVVGLSNEKGGSDAPVTPTHSKGHLIIITHEEI